MSLDCICFVFVERVFPEGISSSQDWDTFSSRIFMSNCSRHCKSLQRMSERHEIPHSIPLFRLDNFVTHSSFCTRTELRILERLLEGEQKTVTFDGIRSATPDWLDFSSRRETRFRISRERINWSEEIAMFDNVCVFHILSCAVSSIDRVFFFSKEDQKTQITRQERVEKCCSAQVILFDGVNKKSPRLLLILLLLSMDEEKEASGDFRWVFSLKQDKEEKKHIVSYKRRGILLFMSWKNLNRKDRFLFSWVFTSLEEHTGWLYRLLPVKEKTSSRRRSFRRSSLVFTLTL